MDGGFASTDTEDSRVSASSTRQPARLGVKETSFPRLGPILMNCQILHIPLPLS
ncbi:hypothetical protein PISMIDRAFT_689885 [Pisolithus microcarpus 441]|uniref:Uncharacterized protein n=1 Tax=Pisolithus microcarpus 441 TaxID=765257 RepID=A0A0C9Y4T1_9AGAM|nr:hypothetical protein PISMIDRAFT_689885 [Pisolithus microcarpus 441]